jgi:PAS domain S-box-containing protein
MKLRIILIVLSLLAFLSASTGGYLYYSSLKESALKEAERQADLRLRTIKRNLTIFLSENVKPVKTLAGMKALQLALTRPDTQNLDAANATLDHFKKTLAIDVCYLMEPSGKTIASSNRYAPDSFVGQNFAFRPYFKNAIAGKPSAYLALGTTSGKRGAYYSHPVFAENASTPVGIVVIKASIELIESELGTELDEIVMVNDPHGVIFISNRKEWLYHLLWKYNEDDIPLIKKSLQFGTGPWRWTGLESRGDYIVDRAGNEYQIQVVELERKYPGWNVVHLRKLDAITKTVIEPLIKTTGPIVLALCVLIGIAVFFLYRQASHEIQQRRSAEEALRESEGRYRSLYHHTPAMLHSIDPGGRLISISDYWVEVMGYSRDEVIGRNLTDFFTPESRQYAETTVFPQFFQNGFCQDIPYQFVKKSGGKIDVLLSAIADRDAAGKIKRSLAVSIDITQRNRAEEALKQAKEELSLYSQDLERLVRKQTEEITNILTYTPAVVYIKDKAGRYTLVNTRYEELFDVRNAEIRGKTDYEILPKNAADYIPIWRLNFRFMMNPAKSAGSAGS